ncbi:MAG TPA: PAS domain-containing protein [Nitrospirota bacterium]|nr:PAS domain-containing protein [Nitrospirota bacterium]
MVQHVFNHDQYHFSFLAIPQFVVAVFIIGLGAFVMVRERYIRIRFIYPLTSLSMGLYMLFMGLVYLSSDQDTMVWWMRGALISTVFMPSTEFLLATAILNRIKRYQIAITATFILAILFSVSVIYSDAFLVTTPRIFPRGDSSWFGPLALIFIFYFLVVAFAILQLYWRAYTGSRDERNKNRMRWIFLSFCIGLLGIVDFLPGLGARVYPFGYVPIACYTAGIAFVIMRYRLVDITPELATNQILETMQSAVIVVDLDGKIRVLNRAAQDMLGYPQNTLLGRGLSELLTAHAGLDRGIDEGMSINCSELCWCRWDGRQVHVNVSTSQLTDHSNGSPIGMVYVAHDITDRKEMAQKIEAAATEWKSTFDAIKDCIMILDRDQRVIRCNKAVRDLMGMPYQHIIGRHCWELVHGTNCPIEGCPTQRMLKTGKRESMVLAMAGRTNLVTADPILNEDGRIHHIVHTISDITELSVLEKKLREAQTLEAIGRLAGGVAHEVRNPLNAILSISEALFNEPEIKDNSSYEPYIRHIRIQVNRLSNLMKDLLELGKPIVSSNMNAVPLHQTCQEILNIWASTDTAVGHPVRVLFDCSCEGPIVLVDIVRFQQVLINLLDNAAQHSPLESAIDVRIVETPDNQAMIQITDKGMGIPTEKINRIFDPFFTTRKGGIGLGLSIVRHIVENMGGVVRVLNNDEQPGCTAEIKLNIDKGAPV